MITRQIFVCCLGIFTALTGLTRAQDTCELSVPVRLEAHSGLALRGVDPGRLNIRLHGGAMPLKVEVTEANESQLFIMLDNSGSMGPSTQGELGKIELARRAVREVLHAVPDHTKVHLAVFSDDGGRFADGVGASLELLSKSPKPFGKTSLFDSIGHAAEQIGQLGGGTILVITDGGDNEGKLTVSKLLPMLARANARVSVLLIQTEPPITSEEERGPYECQELARRSGGRFATLAQDGSVTPSTLEDLLFRTQLRMTIPRTAEEKPWKVSIAKAPGAKQVTARTFDRLPACRLPVSN